MGIHAKIKLEFSTPTEALQSYLALSKKL